MHKRFIRSLVGKEVMIVMSKDWYIRGRLKEYDSEVNAVIINQSNVDMLCFLGEMVTMYETPQSAAESQGQGSTQEEQWGVGGGGEGFSIT